MAFCPIYALAQTVMVFSAGREARDCSMAAQSAGQFQFASREDLTTCTRAIEYGNLKRRDRAATYVNRGILQMARENYQKAFDDYHRALALMPELPEAFVCRGNVFYLSGKYKRAIEDYSKALQFNLSKNHIAHLNRGMAYEKLDEYSHAEENYRRALELMPEWSLAQLKLDRLLAKQKQPTSTR